VVQVLLGQFGLVTSQQMFGQWKFVVVGATVAAAVLTPSTDPFTQVGRPWHALYCIHCSLPLLVFLKGQDHSRRARKII